MEKWGIDKSSHMALFFKKEKEKEETIFLLLAHQLSPCQHWHITVQHEVNVHLFHWQ